MKGKKQKILFCLVALAIVFTWTTIPRAAEISFHIQGDVNLNGPSYGWWYGCTATRAGMMMGYYDQKGYGGLNYANLVPGGVAESSTIYGDGARNALVKDIIASKGHVKDYYSGDNNCGLDFFGISGDDVAVPTHANNSLADFMGTSQDTAGNSNGSTTLYYWTNGAKFTAQDSLTYLVYDSDGMYGVLEYFQYAGYTVADFTSFYTQSTDPSLPKYFSFADYQAEIDAGRVVMIHVEGHSMFGYGYTDDGQIIFDDTWGNHDLKMAWDGTYSNMDMWGVTCFTPTGGTVVAPLPSSLVLLGPALFALLAIRRKN